MIFIWYRPKGKKQSRSAVIAEQNKRDKRAFDKLKSFSDASETTAIDSLTNMNIDEDSNMPMVDPEVDSNHHGKS